MCQVAPIVVCNPRFHVIIHERYLCWQWLVAGPLHCIPYLSYQNTGRHRDWSDVPAGPFAASSWSCAGFDRLSPIHHSPRAGMENHQ